MESARTFHTENGHCVTPVNSTEKHQAQGEDYFRLPDWGVELAGRLLFRGLALMAAHIEQLPLSWLCCLGARKPLLDKVCAF